MGNGKSKAKNIESLTFRNALPNTCRYRAKIFKIFKDDYDSNEAAYVELDFVDYGDSEKKKVSEICNLKIVSEIKSDTYMSKKRILTS